VLALKSLNFKCPILGLTSKLLLEKDEEEETVKDEIQKYSKELTVSKPATSEKSKTENNNSGKIYKLKFCWGIYFFTENGEGDAKTESPEVKVEDEPSPVETVENIPETQTEVKEDAEDTNLQDNSTPDAEVSVEPRPARDDLASLILMWILILSIAFLVYRRLKKNYGIDLVTYFYSITS